MHFLCAAGCFWMGRGRPHLSESTRIQALRHISSPMIPSAAHGIPIFRWLQEIFALPLRVCRNFLIDTRLSIFHFPTEGAPRNPCGLARAHWPRAPCSSALPIYVHTRLLVIVFLLWAFLALLRRSPPILVQEMGVGCFPATFRQHPAVLIANQWRVRRRARTKGQLRFLSLR